MSSALCRKCGVRLDPFLRGQGDEYHINCEPRLELANIPTPPEMDPLKTEVSEIIAWADRNSDRSLQVSIGASEIGSPCERRIGYRMAGIAPVNMRLDPWPAIVGTAIHEWVEKAIRKYQEATGVEDWLVETRVQPDPLIQSRSDAYKKSEALVADWKTSGPAAFKKLESDGPSDEYVRQVNVYGRGYELLGYPVREVALVFFPRAGWLRDTYIWRQPYNRDLALETLARPYAIGKKLLQLDVLNQPHRWEQVPDAPGKSCFFCPWRNLRDPELGASDEGCPGK